MAHSLHLQPLHRIKNNISSCFMLGAQRFSCLPPLGGVVNICTKCCTPPDSSSICNDFPVDSALPLRRGNASLCRLGVYVATRAAGRTLMRGLARPSAEVV
jgi:hypothetical protein